MAAGSALVSLYGLCLLLMLIIIAYICYMLFLNFPNSPYKVGTVISILFIYEEEEAFCSNLSRVTCWSRVICWKIVELGPKSRCV